MAHTRNKSQNQQTQPQKSASESRNLTMEMSHDDGLFGLAPQSCRWPGQDAHVLNQQVRRAYEPDGSYKV